MTTVAAGGSIDVPATRDKAARTGITAAISPLTDVAALGERWRDLEGRSACRFFQSWTWIGTWLAQLGDVGERYVVEVTAGGRSIGLAVFGARRVARHGFVRSRALLLHETGDAEQDRMTIEYNSILAENSAESDVIGAVLQCLRRGNVPWDELVVSGAEARLFSIWRDAAVSDGLHVVLRQESRCCFVNLETVRQGRGDYLALLSANTRQTIRRAMREYGKHGELDVSIAGSQAEASEYLRGLQALHNRHWQGKGEEGAFASEFTRSFHERLVRAAVPRGEVQLMRVTAGRETVGYVYNFVKDGHVYFYQGGFNYSEQSNLKPGLVSHYLAIVHNAKAGNLIYDFLAGASRYKQSLSTGEARMYWFTCQRPRLVFTAERLLKRAKRGVTRSTISRPGARGEK